MLSSSTTEESMLYSSDKAQGFGGPSNESKNATEIRHAELVPDSTHSTEQEAPRTPRFSEAATKTVPHIIRNKKEELLDKARELRERRQKGSDVLHHQPRTLLKVLENTPVLDAQKAVKDHSALDSLQTNNIRSGNESSKATIVDKENTQDHSGEQSSHTFLDSVNIDQRTSSDVSAVLFESQVDAENAGSDLQVPSMPEVHSEPHIIMAGFTSSNDEKSKRSMETQTAVADHPEVQHLLEVNETMKADLQRLQVLVQEHETVMTANQQLTDAVADRDRLLSELRQQHEGLKESIPDVTSKNAELVSMSTSAEQLSKDVECLHRQLKDQRSDMKELQEQLRLTENEKKAQASNMSQLQRSLGESNKQM